MPADAVILKVRSKVSVWARCGVRNAAEPALIEPRPKMLAGTQPPDGVVISQVLDDGARVSIEMGQARFDEPASLTLEGEALQVHRVSMGNPHCVVFVEQPDEALARRLGPLLERHALFPERTNVQLVKVTDRANLDVRIWERGVGYTLSSGTSSCAAAAVAHHLGQVDAKVAVHMPGGTIHIELDAACNVKMQGPVCRIGSFALDPECLGDLA